MSELRLKLFGAPRLERDGKPLKIDTWKALALLAYLALNNHDHTREALATLFWPEQGETQARSSLRRALWTLRQALTDEGGNGGIDGDKQTVRLLPPAGWVVDVLQFQRLVTNAGSRADAITHDQIDLLRAAVTLYQADFLAGFTLPDCPAFDEWQFFTADRLRRRLAEILQQLIDWDVAQQAYVSAIDNARRWLALDGLYEPAQRRLMQLYTWAGQQAAALRQYEECKRQLAEELGVPPEDETTQLYIAIRSNRLAPPLPPRAAAPLSSNAAPPLSSNAAPPLSPKADPPPATIAPSVSAPVRHNLPHLSTPLLGRALDLAELDLLMFDRHERLITITGPGGMGKTRLALAVAERHLAANRLRDGAWFVPLAAIEEAQAIIPALASVFGLATEGVKSSVAAHKQQVLDFLAGKQLLLIFDNFEQVQEGRALLAEILTVAPTVHLLVTSRERLYLRAEQVYPINGLACPSTVADVDAPALILFLRMVRRSQPHFQPGEREQEELVRICQLTEGMPLALELAAGWAPVLPLSAIAEALQSNFDLLETIDHAIPMRHRSMRAAFDTSWALLTEEERHCFAQLSVFRGGFTRVAAQQVATVTMKQLALYGSKSLLNYHRETDRYTLHELLRQYAGEKLEAHQQQEATHWRHLHYFLTLVETMAHQLNGPRQEEALTTFDREQSNFRAALTWGFATPLVSQPVATTVAWLTVWLERFWDLRHQWQEGRDWLNRALALVERQTKQIEAIEIADEREQIELKAALLLQAGRFANNFTVAQPLLEASLAYYQSLNDQRLIAQCLYELGAIVVNRGDYGRAKALYGESLTYARQIDDRQLLANILVRLAGLFVEENEIAQGTALAQESLEHFRRQQDSRGVISTQILLAQCHLARGEYGQTSALLEEVLALGRILDPQSKGGPWTYRILGLAEQMQGHYVQAADYYRRSLLLRQEQQESGGVAWALEGLVEVAAATAQPLQAAHLAGAAEKLRQQIGSTISNDDLPRYQQALRLVCEVLGEARFQAAWASGALLSLEQIVAYALSDALLY